MKIMDIKKLLAIDKFQRALQAVKANGGWKASLYQLYRMDALKLGKCVGADKYGNKYYQNNMYFFASNRWVEYADRVGVNYDASQVPAEWFGWLHYKTDCPPKDPCKKMYPWIADHEENKSGTCEEYMPYSTTRPKILPWIPPKSKCPEK